MASNTPAPRERLREIAERLAKATPGPWAAEGQHWAGTYWREFVIQALHPRVANLLRLPMGVNHQYDATFIANAPEDLAWCLAEIERLNLGEALYRREAEQALAERDQARAELASEAEAHKWQAARAERYRDALSEVQKVADDSGIKEIYNWGAPLRRIVDIVSAALVHPEAPKEQAEWPLCHRCKRKYSPAWSDGCPACNAAKGKAKEEKPQIPPSHHVDCFIIGCPGDDKCRAYRRHEMKKEKP